MQTIFDTEETSASASSPESRDPNMSPPDLPPQETVNGPNSELSSLFSSAEDRNDVALGLALSGQTLESAIQFVERFYHVKQATIENAHKPALIAIDEVIVTARRRVEKKQATIDDLEKRLGQLRTDVTQREAEIPILQLKHDDAWLTLLRHRVDHGREFFKAQQEELKKEVNDNREQILAEIDAQIEIDRTIYEIQKANRDINSAEFKRRIDLCIEEKAKIERQLEEATKYADNLKKIGVTRTSATFLFVAGFISLAGVGSVISNLLYGRQPAEDVLSRIIQNLGSIIDGIIPSQLGYWRAPLRPFVFLMLLLLFLTLFYGLIRLMDWLVKKFDEQTWRGEKEDTETGSKMPQGSSRLLKN